MWRNKDQKVNVKKKKINKNEMKGRRGREKIKISESTHRKGERDSVSKTYIDYNFKLVSVKTNG